MHNKWNMVLKKNIVHITILIVVLYIGYFLFLDQTFSLAILPEDVLLVGQLC